MPTMRALLGGIAAGSVLACTSFSAGGPTSLADGGADAGAEGAALPDGSTLAECASGDPAAEAAGLYLAGGYAADGSDAADVLRAPIRCDGQLGAWTVIKTLTRAAVMPVATALGDVFIIFGGQSHEGAPYLDAFDYAPFDARGGIGELRRRPAMPDQTRPWRAQWGSNGTTLFVAGGEIPMSNGGMTATAIASATLWRLQGGIPTPTGLPALPRPAARGGGAMIGSTMFVLAPGDDDPAPDVNRGPGTIYSAESGAMAWQAGLTFDDFDFSTAASANAIYTVSGAVDATAVNVFVYEDGVLRAGVKAAARLPSPMYGAGAAIFNGRLYVVGGEDSGSLTVAAKLTAFGVAADGFQTTTPLPSSRSFGVAFVR